jgi:glycosyltransferase involved in cell wall biosynthesis
MAQLPEEPQSASTYPQRPPSPEVRSGRSDIPGSVTRRLVRHFGPRVGEAGGGGMASVLATYSALDLARYRMEFTTTASLHTRFKSAEHLPSAVTSLVGTARQAPPPIAHFHLSSGGSLVREGGLLRAGRRLGLPTVATVHASDLEREVREKPQRLRRVLGAAHVVHVLGPATAGLLEPVVGERSEIVVIPNCVVLPTAYTPAGDRPPRVLFAGEISMRKGVDVLLAAWPAVRATVPGAELLVLGAARDFAVPPLDGVAWAGAVGRERVLAEVDNCRVAVLPTRAEAQPMFILEAMAAGRPIVTTPVAEIAGTIGDAGALVAVGDVDALAAAIIEFLEDPRRATAAGDAGRERIGRLFSTDRVGRDLQRLYDKALVAAGCEPAGEPSNRPR